MSTKKKSPRSTSGTRKGRASLRRTAEPALSPPSSAPVATTRGGGAESASRLFGFGNDKLTDGQKDVLRRHVINMSRGKFQTSGEFDTTAEDVKTLFTQHLPEALRAAEAEGHPLRVLFWAHGGLVSERDALDQVLIHYEGWLRAGIYPVYFIWETDFMSALKSILGLQRGLGSFIKGIKDKAIAAKDAVVEAKDDALEFTLHKSGVSVWGEMKKFADLASAPGGAARFTAERLAEFMSANKEKPVELYACGHSAGSIFHSFFLPAAGRAGVKFRELYLLAPAITVQDFASRLSNEIGEDRTIGRTTMFTMTDTDERADNVAKIYNKSLLYFVSGACEPARNTDILGMEVCLRKSQAMHDLFGLAAASARGTIVLSPNGRTIGTSASNSTTHGGFDNDYTTLNSMARRITRDSSVDVFVPEVARGLSLVRTGAGRAAAGAPAGEALRVRLSLRFGKIEEVKASAGEPPVTAFAAGHYQGAEPAAAEWALDRAVSRAHDAAVEEKNFIVYSLFHRGILPAALGSTQIFPFPDKRYVVLAGLGMLGTVGAAELALAVRELCLSVSRIGVTHLASVLIGSGNGNLSTRAAFAAWIEGIQRASLDKAFKLKQITFCEYSPEKFIELASCAPEVLRQERVTNADKIWNPHTKDHEEALKEELASRQKKIDLFKEEQVKLIERRAGSEETNPEPDTDQTTRINIRGTESGYIFSALTNEASVPEREILLDPRLVDAVAVELSTTPDAREQRVWGRTLEKLLIPEDIRDKLFNSAAHLVLTVDASTARIPWEMLLLPSADRVDTADSPESELFIGTAEHYGLTRQLQTGFAPAPQPAYHRAGKLRAIVIADPAPDASLPGARQEGAAVKACLERHGVEVVLLTGEQASRAAVARALLTERFDILHFAGHCFFDREEHVRSGWVFRGDPLECFTAREMARLGSVPPFIFSNACESGITPDRKRDGSLPVAPAFAESFFARGVRNFICTGWEVNDAAAVAFAERFYTLALERRATFGEAVREARREAMACDTTTWGAYQHYGNRADQFQDTADTSAAAARRIVRAALPGPEAGEEMARTADAVKPRVPRRVEVIAPPGRPYSTPGRDARPDDLIEVKLDPAAMPALDRMSTRSFSALRSGTEPSASAAGIIAGLVDSGDIVAVTPVTDGKEVTSRSGLRGAFTAGHEHLSPDDPLAGVSIVRVRPGSAARVLGRLTENPAVTTAALVPLRYLAAGKKTAGAPPAGAWNLPKIKWAEARKLAGFKEPKLITVAVLDTGIEPGHPDLKGLIKAGDYHFDPAETRVSNRDIIGHGTHVAGTIAANFANKIGVRGLCACRLMAWKIFSDKPWQDDRKGTRSYFVDAVMYLRALAACVEKKVNVINLSIGGTDPASPQELALFRRLNNNGTVVVAAMGNEREEGDPTSYPAAIPGVIAVGATDRHDADASFSNTGKHIALSAPGVAIWSTLPTYPGEYNQLLDAASGKWKSSPRERDYASWDGTSMASPHVAAAAAMLLATKGIMSPAEVKKALQNSADKVPGMKKKSFTVEFGAGRLNLLRLLK